MANENEHCTILLVYLQLCLYSDGCNAKLPVPTNLPPFLIPLCKTTVRLLTSLCNFLPTFAKQYSSTHSFCGYAWEATTLNATADHTEIMDAGALRVQSRKSSVMENGEIFFSNVLQVFFKNCVWWWRKLWNSRMRRSGATVEIWVPIPLCVTKPL